MRQSTSCSALIVAALLSLASATAQDYKVAKVKDPGTIKGRVFFGGDFPKPEPFLVPGVYAQHCGTSKPNEEFIVSPENKGLKNAVIYLEGIKAGKAFSKVAPKLQQEGCQYVPHVQVVPAGASVEIVNQDDTLHNVHSYFDPDGKRSTLFNIAQPIKGKKDHKKLTKVGVVKVECDVHRWMSSYLIVRDNPYYALTKADGSYEITGVPPGSYELVMWQEGLGQGKKRVVVKAGEVTEVPFQIGKSEDDESAGKAKKDKGDR